MGWIRGKIQERKDRDAERRTRTPERNQSSANGRQEFGTPVHMDSLTERHRDAPSSAAGIEASAPPQHVSGATVVTPAPAANTTGNPSSMHPQVQGQKTAEPTQVSSTSAPAEIVEVGQPSVPSDPAVHDHVSMQSWVASRQTERKIWKNGRPEVKTGQGNGKTGHL